MKRRAILLLRCPAVCDDPLPKHEAMAAMENPVSMSSGDLLQDWSSNNQTQVRSPAVQKLQLQLAQAPSAFSLYITLHYSTLITSFWCGFFPTWYVTCFPSLLFSLSLSFFLPSFPSSPPPSYAHSTTSMQCSSIFLVYAHT